MQAFKKGRDARTSNDSASGERRNSGSFTSERRGSQRRLSNLLRASREEDDEEASFARLKRAAIHVSTRAAISKKEAEDAMEDPEEAAPRDEEPGHHTNGVAHDGAAGATADAPAAAEAPNRRRQRGRRVSVLAADGAQQEAGAAAEAPAQAEPTTRRKRRPTRRVSVFAEDVQST
jgi:hypothetical protein